MKVIWILVRISILAILALLFWHSVIPGILLGILFKGRWEQIVAIVAGACITVCGIYFSGGWIVFPEIAAGSGMVTRIIGLLIGWVLSAFLFLAGYRVYRSFMEGRAGTPKTGISESV